MKRVTLSYDELHNHLNHREATNAFEVKALAAGIDLTKPFEYRDDQMNRCYVITQGDASGD